MADNAVETAINTKIQELLDAMDPHGDRAVSILHLAAAVNQLAEARAWTRTAAQPHGGNVIPSDE